MRVSTYEIILPLIGSDEQPIEGKRLLVNGLYGSVDVVDESTATRLLGNNLDELPVPARERLAARGHITRKTPQEEQDDVSLLGNVYDRTLARSETTLAILPTYDCNFRCPYCFESHRLARGQEWLSRRMRPEMVEATFGGLQKMQDEGYRINACMLYGGEPLMEGNEDVVRNICAHARQMGLKITAVTNGYDLEGYLDLLEEFEFSRLQVTVDGVGEQNDCRRRHRDGVPTYDRIMSNIRLALDRGVNVQLRVNVNRNNINGIPDLIADLAARGLTDSKYEGSDTEERRGSFSYYFKAVSEDPSSPTRVTEQEVMDAIVATGIPPIEALDLQSQYSMAMGNLEEMATKERYPICHNTYCGAESGALVVDPEGKVHACWDLVAMDADSVGYVDEESKRFAYGFAKARWRLRTSTRMEACMVCPYVFLCRGGCASDARRESGSLFHEHCGEFPEIFAYVAPRVMGRRWEKDGNDELSVSLYGPLSRMTPEERNELMTTTSGKRAVELLRQTELVRTKEYP